MLLVFGNGEAGVAPSHGAKPAFLFFPSSGVDSSLPRTPPRRRRQVAVFLARPVGQVFRALINRSTMYPVLSVYVFSAPLLLSEASHVADAAPVLRTLDMPRYRSSLGGRSMICRGPVAVVLVSRPRQSGDGRFSESPVKNCIYWWLACLRRCVFWCLCLSRLRGWRDGSLQTAVFWRGLFQTVVWLSRLLIVSRRAGNGKFLFLCSLPTAHGEKVRVCCRPLAREGSAFGSPSLVFGPYGW